ncbi:unnamed protein product [Phytophthora lilii]|uniref:Unnamed protein product n=1 Tax=Phytophthora lilii TaxID=2077276 RepID=A0A9W6TF64_9STRA|nr:unnamed protein product [Phytophthora lilii]
MVLVGRSNRKKKRPKPIVDGGPATVAQLQSRREVPRPFPAMDESIAETFDVTPVQSRAVLAPNVPAVTALAAARRAPFRRKKLKWRTRDSQASQLYNLELDVMGLRQEIQRLHEYQQVFNARTFNRRDALDGYYVKTVMEYHRVFENGYHPGAAIDAAQFVKEIMDENIAIGRFAGRDVLLHQWELYTKAMSGLEFHYVSSRVVSTDEQTLVTSYARYKHVLTPDTLEVMFPDAMRQHPRIASRMLGRVFHGEGHYNFTFDTQTHRVVSFNFELDFLRVFAHLLQDPRDLCAFFQGARISKECLIGDWACYDERQNRPKQEIPAATSEMKTAPDFPPEWRNLETASQGDHEYRQPSLTGAGKRGRGHLERDSRY